MGSVMLPSVKGNRRAASMFANEKHETTRPADRKVRPDAETSQMRASHQRTVQPIRDDQTACESLISYRWRTAIRRVWPTHSPNRTRD